MLARKTSKNQLTLPKEIVGSFPEVDLFDASVEDGRIVLTPVKVTPLTTSIEAVRKKMQRLGVTEADVGEAVRWARG